MWGRPWTIVVGSWVLVGVAAGQEADPIPPLPGDVSGPALNDDGSGPELFPAPPAALPGAAVEPKGDVPAEALPSSAEGSERPAIGDVPAVVASPSSEADVPPAIREPRALDEEVRSRYRLVGGEWWFRLRSGAWKYYRGGEWRDFDPASYVPPELDPGARGSRPYVANRLVSPVGPAIDLPLGYRLIPADAVDLRTGTYYGPMPEESAYPAEEGRGYPRGGPVRSFVRGVIGRLR